MQLDAELFPLLSPSTVCCTINSEHILPQLTRHHCPLWKAQ